MRDYCARQQEQAHAAKDDRGRYPRLVRPFELWFANSQDDECQHGEEIKCVADHAVEREQGVKLAYDDVSDREDTVEHQGVDRGEEKAGVLVCDEA